MRKFKRSISLKLQGNIEFGAEFTKLKFEKNHFPLLGNIESREFVYDKV
jgi:hypothetical protein